MQERYGTSGWLENMFQLSDDDPWGHNWRGVEQYRHDLILKLIIKHILNEAKINNELKVLDIGCSTGDFTNRLYEVNKNVIGIDISKTAIKKAKAKFSYIDFRIVSLTKSGFPNNTFDLITCLEVLYYMDKYKQKIFLCEISNLLKKGGRVMFTSLIGEKPYFDSKEFICLVSEHFQIKAVEYYGAKAYSCVEKVLFNKYQQINKIQRLLTLNQYELEKEINSLNNQRKRMIKNAIFFFIRFKFLKFIIYIFLQFIKYTIKISLSWKFPAKLTHFISKKLSLRQTHTFVLVAKKGE